MSKSCTDRRPGPDFNNTCYEIYNYACNPGEVVGVDTVWHEWKNLMQFLSFICICNIGSYLIMCLIHHYKAGNAKGFKKREIVNNYV